MANSFSYTLTELDYYYIKKLIRAHLTAGSYITSTNNLSDLADTNEALNNLLPNQTGNSGKVLSTNGSDTLWVSSSSLYNDENAQDAVGTILVDSSTIDFTYNDGTPSITASVIDGSISTTKLGSDITTAGKALLDDADAAAQRTTLGLGTLATQSGTFSGTSSGTNTGDQNLFSTITISGQSNVVADSTSDTLTLIAGTNITLTTDATNDTITITAASGGISLSNAYAVSSLRI